MQRRFVVIGARKEHRMENVQFAYYETESGCIEIGTEADAVCILRFAAKPQLPNRPTALSDRVAEEVLEYLAGVRKRFTVPVRIAGTPFRQMCYRAVQQIPYGETRTYGQIAAEIGSPNAARAVGAAMARNPVWLLVPCHRVLGANGALTGYAGGLALKQRLLQLEQQLAF